MKRTDHIDRQVKNFLFRHSPGDSLSRTNLLSLLLAVFLPVFWFPSCEKVDTRGEDTTNRPDSVIINMRVESKDAIRNMDIFIYGQADRLENHTYYANVPDTMKAKVPVGRKKIVAIANSKYRFKDAALSKYESTESLYYNLTDEDQAFPILSCEEECDENRIVTLSPKRILCTITLESVEHSFRDYKRMEDPRIMLSDYPASASILRMDGLRPSETSSDTTGLKGLVWDKLPYDIGMFAQHPATSIFCYPGDDTSSASAPVFIVESETDGHTYRYETPLPVLKRGATVYVSLKVESKPEKYKFSFR